jgi:hypothetical protein
MSTSSVEESPSTPCIGAIQIEQVVDQHLQTASGIIATYKESLRRVMSWRRMTMALETLRAHEAMSLLGRENFDHI